MRLQNVLINVFISIHIDFSYRKHCITRFGTIQFCYVIKGVSIIKTHHLKTQTAADQTIALPGSKSISNRALLLAALAQGQSTLSNFLESNDTLSFLQALMELGVAIDRQGARVIVQGGKPFHDATISCSDAGTAARFLLAACAAMPGNFHLTGSKRLSERPLHQLVHVLREQGAKIDAMQLPLQVQGGLLQGGSVSLAQSDSSQFVSALLMASPLMRESLDLQVIGLARDAYITLTCQMMAQFGVHVTQQHHRYQVALPQHYHARDYVIEPDVSTASYFFAKAAVTGGRVVVRDIIRNTCLQGDIAFLTVLEKMGCRVQQLATGIEVIGPLQLKGVTIDMNNFSDTFMTLACIAPFADSPTLITGLAHTRLQESDRVNAISAELLKLNVRTETGDDWIRIYPSEVRASCVHSHHDHRIAMSLTLIGLKVPGILLEDSDAVSKTCPQFFEWFDAQ